MLLHLPLYYRTVFLQASAGGQYPNWHGSSAPQHLRPMIEVELCQGLAAKCDAEKPTAPKVCAGIMGWADFQDPRVEELLLADCRVRNFRGIRGPLPVSFHLCMWTGVVLERSRGVEASLWYKRSCCMYLIHSIHGLVTGYCGCEFLPRHGLDGKVRLSLRCSWRSDETERGCNQVRCWQSQRVLALYRLFSLGLSSGTLCRLVSV
eukprot:COSAG02_NODE_1676_length_11364_cov_12.500755_9_plen_206_part_00